MSNVSLANNKKKKYKKIKSSLKNEGNKSTFEKIKHSTNLDVFKMNTFLNEKRDKNLKIFHQKEMKKSNVPSLSTFLLSSNKDSEISLLNNNSIKKPELTRIKEYSQYGDIFTSTITNSTINHNRQFNNTLSPLNKNNRESYDYTISDMLSDSLTQKHNYEQKFTYKSNSVDSEAVVSPLGINKNVRKTGNYLIAKKDCKKDKKVNKKNLQNNGNEFNLLCTNFETKKQIKETTDYFKLKNSLKDNKEFEKNKTIKKSSTTVVSSEKNDTEITSLLYNPINQYLQPEKRNYDDNEEPCIVCKDENLTVSPFNGINKKRKDCSTSDSFCLENSNHEMNYNVDFDKHESNTVNIVVSECNLDYLTNSEDISVGSVEMINAKADKYLMDNELDLTAEEKSVPKKNSRMNFTRNKNLEFSNPLLNTINFVERDSVIESAKASDALQNSFQSSDSCNELLNIRVQLSGQSTASSTSDVMESDFSQRYRIHFQNKNVIHPDSRNSSFGISQATYVKQRSSFFNRKKTKDKAAATFKLNLSIPKEVNKFGTEIHLPANAKHNFTSKYENNDSDKENERQISFPHKQLSGHKELKKMFTNSSAMKLASINSMTKSSKRRYPFDKNCKFSNIEMNDNCKKAKQTVENVGTVQNAWSENRHISIDQISSSNFNTSNISNENSIERFSPSNFWRVSDEVQNFVKVWLDKQDAINCKHSKICVDREKLVPKYTQRDLNSEKREKRIDINPAILLSNYSCEYDEAYRIDCFKI